MFWNTDQAHGLPHNPFKACVVPRPIGWISTISPEGIVNLSPYSFFNACAEAPPMVMFSTGHRPEGDSKDTITNCEKQGEFVVNIATWDLREQMNKSSAAVAPEVDETVYAGLETVPAEMVAPPRVAASPIHLECTYWQTVAMPTGASGKGNFVVFGRVVGVHIDDAVLTDGLVDMAKVQPIARLGYLDYARVDTVFSLPRPEVGGPD